MKHFSSLSNRAVLPGSATLITLLSTVALSGAVHAACDFNGSSTGSCRLSAEVTGQGLKITTNGVQCATVDYQVNGASQRMFIDQGAGLDPKVQGSAGVQVLNCKSYGKAATSSAPTGDNVIRTSEQIVSTNLVATGQRTVSVNVPVYEKRVYVERQVPVEKKVYIEKPVYIEKHIPVEKKVYVEKPVYIERQVPVEKRVVVQQRVPVDRPVYVPYYIKPQVDVRYNQVVQGLPAGVQVQNLPQPSFQQPSFQQPSFQQQPANTVAVQPAPQQQVTTGGILPAGTIINTTPIR